MRLLTIEGVQNDAVRSNDTSWILDTCNTDNQIYDNNNTKSTHIEYKSAYLASAYTNF